MRRRSTASTWPCPRRWRSSPRARSGTRAPHRPPRSGSEPMALALSSWWYVGWVIAAVVVVIAATLLLAIIFIGKRVARQADDVTVALDGARANTDPLWDVKQININLDRVNSGLVAARKALGG